MEELTAIKTADGREFKPWASKETVQEVVQQAVQDPASITAIASDIASGKSELSASISAKGVPSTTLDSFSSMATKIRQIPQTVNTGLSDFDQMVAPNPYIWNVYTVAEDLMKNELPDYIPTYMSGYKSRYGANSFFVGEYYRGYDSLELTGADGYLTHDGDFYTIADGTVTHTLPDGTVETYSDTTIIHTWHDTEMTQCNRWVAFFYLNNAYSFTNITSSICPRRVALCGTCNSFIVSGENRLTDVWVIGTLGHFEGGTTGNSWNPAQVIRNYRDHNAGVFYDGANLVSCIMLDLKDINIGTLLQDADIDTLVLPKLESVNVTGGILKNNVRTDCNVNIIEAPLLKHITHTLIYLSSQKGTFMDKANSFKMDNVEVVDAPVFYLYCGTGGTPYVPVTNMKIISFNSVTNISGSDGLFYYRMALNTPAGSLFPALEKISLASLQKCSSLLFNATRYQTTANLMWNLIDIEVGSMITNLNIRCWKPTNVLADPDKTATLIDNIKNHILARVSDATGGTQLVFTVSTNMYNAIANENIEWQGETMTLADAFLTKNWLFAGA